MATQFLKASQTTSDIIAPISSFKIKMAGQTGQLTNWILECAEKNVDDDDKDWAQCSANGYDWSTAGNRVEDFEGSPSYVYRLRRTTGTAGATATWGNMYTAIWR